MPGHLAKVGGGGRGARSRGESVSCTVTVARAVLLPFLIDQFLVLKKEQKAKEREFKIYRKQYQCSVWVLSFALCIRIRSSKFGVAPLASHAATAPSFRSSHERRHGPMSAPGWRCLKLLNLSTWCSFPRPLPPIPCIPSHLPLTGSTLAMQKEPAPPWTGCWGWGSPGEEPMFGALRAGSPLRAERTHQGSAPHQHGGSQML